MTTRTLRVPMPMSVDVLVYPYRTGDGRYPRPGWVVKVMAVAIGVDTGTPDHFGLEGWYQAEPTSAEIRAVVLAYLDHEVAEQLGERPHEAPA